MTAFEDKLRAAEVTAPDDRSTTRFVPFVVIDVTPEQRDALADAIEALRRMVEYADNWVGDEDERAMADAAAYAIDRLDAA